MHFGTEILLVDKASADVTLEWLVRLDFSKIFVRLSSLSLWICCRGLKLQVLVKSHAIANMNENGPWRT